LKAALFSSLISKIEYLPMTVIPLGQAKTSVAGMYARGNTLLELMFTLAILAVLSTSASYFYRDYVSRAQMAAGLAEITPGKQAVELQLSEGLNTPMISP
jgi:prepilin-type N-terminal cleavage/methylation domain-containing protein